MVRVELAQDEVEVVADSVALDVVELEGVALVDLEEDGEERHEVVADARAELGLHRAHPDGGVGLDLERVLEEGPAGPAEQVAHPRVEDVLLPVGDERIRPCPTEVVDDAGLRARMRAAFGDLPHAALPVSEQYPLAAVVWRSPVDLRS